MSRITKNPLPIPKGVELKCETSSVSVKGPKGALHLALHPLVLVELKEAQIFVQLKALDKGMRAKKGGLQYAGTIKALLKNMLHGVTEGYTKKLELHGVGYKAQVKGKKLELALGYSHPVVFSIPEGITITAASPTELSVFGVDKHQVGQVSANIRRLRPPEVYKGKGVRYADEHIEIKEVTKK